MYSTMSPATMYRIFSVESFSKQTSASLTTFLQQLREKGYVLRNSDDSEHTMGEIKDHEADLILIDTDIANGYQLCQHLKNDPDTENIPVIFVQTGNASNTALLRSFEAGASDYIPLQKSSDEVFARVQAAIRNKQAASQSIALANQLTRMNNELYQRNLQVERELYVARQLQQSLLPPFIPDGNSSAGELTHDISQANHFSKCHYRDERLKISGVYLPCDALGGDIYDVIPFPDGTVGVTVADVSGHGVPAGFITAIFKSSFYRITHGHSAPNDILYHLNNELADIVKTGEYVTAAYCRIRPHQNASDGLLLDFSGAGHPYPVFYQAQTNTISRLQENGTPLVWIKNIDYPLGTVALAPGDKLLLFTDGVSEMRNAQEELFGEKALEQLFLKLIENKSPYILDDLIQALSDYTEGHPLEDDLSMVLIEA